MPPGSISNRRWLLEVTRELLRHPPEERGVLLAERVSDASVRTAIENTLSGLDESVLEPRGALRGALWDDLLAALAEDGASAEAAEPLAGGRLGRIRVEERISAGGMGEVYRGYDELLERPVALKTLRPDHDLGEAARARFLREARLLSRLDHPHVCRLYDLVEHAGREALVLELVPGGTLHARLAAGPPLAEAETLRIAAEIASGLAAAHAAGVIHRDLKPSNVMLTPAGEVKIVDFGIARREDPAAPAAGGEPAAAAARDDDATRHGTTLGTIAYMSPEQARGERLTPASDIYSFGVVLQELFSGRPAYDEVEPLALLEAVQRAGTRPLAGLPAGVAEVLRQMQAPAPEDRPPAAEVERRLRHLGRRPAELRTRRRLATAGVAALLLAGLLAFLAARWARPEPLFTRGEAPRLAVLPFVNATSESEVDWVELGLAEMVSDSLASVPGLGVVPFAEVSDAIGRGDGGAGAAFDPGDGTTDRLARALGATVVLTTRVEPGRAAGGYRLVYQASRPGVDSRPRTLAAADLIEGGNELAARLVRRLAPDALAPDLAERFSEDPLVNRLYAMGLQRLRQELAVAAEPFFRVSRELDPGFLEARLRLAEALTRQSRWEEAETEAAGVVGGARAAERPALEAAGLTALANVAYGRDRREEAVGFGREALAAAKRSGAAERVAAAHIVLGRTLRFLDRTAARRAFSDALDGYRGVGNRVGEGRAAQGLGVVADEDGDERTAEVRFREALAIGEETGAIHLESTALDSLAILAGRREDHEEAVGLLTRSVDLNRRAGDRRSLIFGLNNLGDSYHELERLAEAEAAFAEAESLCAEIEAPNACALLAYNHAELLLATGRVAPALPLIERSAAYYGDGDPDIRYLRAMRWARDGDPARGRRLLAEAMAGAGAVRAEAYRRQFAELSSGGD